MSIITPKTEIAFDVVACRACLSTSRKLCSINQYQVLKTYKNLLGIEVSPIENLPQYICTYCNYNLMKYNKFRQNCLNAKKYLEEAQRKNICITKDYLNNFKPLTRLKRTEIEVMTYVEDSIEEVDTFKIEPETLDNHEINNETDDTPDFMYIDNIEAEPSDYIYTDLLKIEVPETVKKEEINEKLTLKTVKKKLKENYKNVKRKRNVKENLKNNVKLKNNYENKVVIKKKGKFFETKENIKDFEINFDVDIIVLSQEEQLNEFLERKSSDNYVHSPYKCDLCYKGYMGADLLNKHILSHHDPIRGDVLCEFCQFRYNDRRGLNNHLKTHRLKFSCRVCHFISRTTFNAKQHFKMHEGQIHKCQHCGKSYEKASSYLSHLRLSHPNELILCELCGEAFVGAHGLNAHTKKAHRHLSLTVHCSSCDKRFVDKAAVDRHMANDSCHKDACVHCGDVFSDKLELRDHLLKIHRSLTAYTCEKCNKPFASETLYRAHYKRLHVDSAETARRKNERPWVCEVCGKTLSKKSHLLYHQRTHTGEKPYHCSECPKSFTLKRSLQSHLRVHSSKRDFACKYCPKTYKGRAALRTHLFIHTGGPPKPTPRRKI